MEIKHLGHHSFLEFSSLKAFNVLQASFQKHGDPTHNSIQELLKTTDMAWAKQVHGCDILKISKKGFCGEGDALITDRKNIALCIGHADCQVALFYDPTKHIAAAVHCGWKGSIQKIYTKTLSALTLEYGCKPQDIYACISPSLGPDASQFIHFEKELPTAFLQYQFKPFYFDFWKISYDELINAGVLPSHIEMARICTKSNPGDYFSYRYNKTDKRLLTFISLL